MVRGPFWCVRWTDTQTFTRVLVNCVPPKYDLCGWLGIRCEELINLYHKLCVPSWSPALQYEFPIVPGVGGTDCVHGERHAPTLPVWESAAWRQSGHWTAEPAPYLSESGLLAVMVVVGPSSVGVRFWNLGTSLLIQLLTHWNQVCRSLWSGSGSSSIEVWISIFPFLMLHSRSGDDADNDDDCDDR